MGRPGENLADALPAGLAALVLLALSWLLARLAATAAHRSLQRIQPDSRLARLIGADQEADRDRIARRVSRVVLVVTLLAVVVLDLRLFLLPLISDPIDQFIAQARRYGRSALEVIPVSLPVEILLALIATGVLILMLRALARWFPKAYAQIDSWRGTRVRSLHIQRVEILSADRITDVLLQLARWLRVALVLALLYLYVLLVFSFFPPTRTLATTLFGYVSSTLGAAWQAFISYLPNLFLIAVIVIGTRYVIKFVRFIFDEIGKGTITLPGFYRDWAGPTYNIVRLLILALAAVMVFPYLPGSATPAFQGISIFFGFLISLGSTSVVANIVAGTVLTYMCAFSVGDRVRIADAVGDVVEKTLLVTRVRTIKNVEITIPNAMVLASHIVNYSATAKSTGLILHTSVTIGYDVPWRHVHELLIAAARATENVLQDPTPFVLQTALDDFYVRYELNAYTDRPNVMAKTYSDLHQNIQDRFDEGGVEILSPHYRALRAGHQTTIPED